MNIESGQKLCNLIISVQNRTLRYVAETLLGDNKFLEWPASLGFHHHYVGGLLTHTVEVADYALAAAEAMNLDPTSRDVLVVSALFHDFMKIRDYEKTPYVADNRRHILTGNGAEAFITCSDYGTIRHIQGSAIEFAVRARSFGVSQELEERITHCLIAHHGRPEWGSPVEPQTVEALLLHQADMVSAKFGATKNPITD